MTEFVVTDVVNWTTDSLTIFTTACYIFGFVVPFGVQVIPKIFLVIRNSQLSDKG